MGLITIGRIAMTSQITISTKNKNTGDYGHKIISVRMKDELLERLDDISIQTNRSRNEVINILLTAAVEIVSIE